jgi:hypothetical protein
MSSHHHHHQQHATNGRGAHPAHVPYWKRAHTDWRFWVGVMLMVAAMMIYVMSFDLALRPRPQLTQPISGSNGL